MASNHHRTRVTSISLERLDERDSSAVKNVGHRKRDNGEMFKEEDHQATLNSQTNDNKDEEDGIPSTKPPQIAITKKASVVSANQLNIASQKSSTLSNRKATVQIK